MGRVESLDLIRGIAVLGILAINIAGFAGPTASVLTPDIPHPATFADRLAFAVTFVVFEGKMRGLFCLLFGASIVLFIERNDAAGGHGDLMQLRRLGWLVLFGALHYYLLWWGDILFTYGVIGIIALMMRELPPRTLAKIAVTVLVLWHAGEMVQSLPELRADEAVRTGTASAPAREAHQAYLRAVNGKAARELASYADSIPGQAIGRLRDDPLRPLTAAFAALGETLPLMLLGMALFRTGFFTAGWPRRMMWTTALGATLAGLALTAALLAWAWPRGFPVRSMSPIVISWTGIPHLLMTLGYAAALVLATPFLARTRIGHRLAQAGRMAFSNYIGTTLLMTWVFHGWGIGLAGRFGHAGLMPFVALGWLAMLAFSAVWLAFCRRGPLEWVWRSLAEKRWLANRA